MNKAAKFLLASQLVLLVALVICTILLPKFLFSTDQGGASNYGVNAKTIVPFTVGFVGCGLLVILGAGAVEKQWQHAKGFRASLRLIGILCVMVAATTYTYKINNFFDRLHIYSAIAIFFAELPLAFWYALRLALTSTAKRLLIAYMIGFLLAGLTFFGWLHILFVAEVLATFSFGWLMVHTADRLAIQKS